MRTDILGLNKTICMNISSRKQIDAGQSFRVQPGLLPCCSAKGGSIQQCQGAICRCRLPASRAGCCVLCQLGSGNLGCYPVARIQVMPCNDIEEVN